MAKILILEDNPERIEIFFEKFGDKHDITCVDKARAAIDRLRDTTFDIIFLDHDLDGRIYVDPAESNTGSEVVRYLVSGAYNDSPIVVVHSRNELVTGDMEKALSYAGFENYIIPFPDLVARKDLDWIIES